MPIITIPQGRRPIRMVSKRRASLVVNLDRTPKRLSCLIVDYSKEGFRLHGSFDLRRGQIVELIFDDDMLVPQRCRVVWAGKVGSKQEGAVGLETL